MFHVFRGGLFGGLIILSSLVGTPSAAQESKRASTETSENVTGTRRPETRARGVDRERLTVRRVDIVDKNGVIRMTLAAPTPTAIIDGIQHKREFPVSGLILYDKNGNERGGYAVADIEGTAVVAAQDHVNSDAIGWRVMPDGSVTFIMNERPPVQRKSELGNAVVPGDATTRIEMNVAADGVPTISLSDKKNQPRVRLTVTKEGYGAIEFLDSAGKVVEILAPEAQKATEKGDSSSSH